MPPLKQQTANGQPRSLLMDIKHPNIPLDQLSLEDAGSSSSGSIRATPRVFSYRKDQLTAKRQWWDQPKAPVRRDPVRDVSFFEFNMPEHLPNSPMCPANPLNKGKLKVCVVRTGQTLLHGISPGILFLFVTDTNSGFRSTMDGGSKSLWMRAPQWTTVMAMVAPMIARRAKNDDMIRRVKRS